MIIYTANEIVSIISTSNTHQDLKEIVDYMMLNHTHYNKWQNEIFQAMVDVKITLLENSLNW